MEKREGIFPFHSLNMEEIESRIIVLKMKAAEADRLREERDMLLNTLQSLYPVTGDSPPQLHQLMGERATRTPPVGVSFQSDPRGLQEVARVAPGPPPEESGWIVRSPSDTPLETVPVTGSFGSDLPQQNLPTGQLWGPSPNVQQSDSQNTKHNEQLFSMNRFESGIRPTSQPEDGKKPQIQQESFSGTQFQKEYETCQKEKRELAKNNAKLQTVIVNLTNSMRELQASLKEKERIQIENERLKDKEKRLEEMEKLSEKLTEENNNLKLNIENIMELSTTDDPQFKYKAHLHRLCVQVNRLEEQKENLKISIMSRDNKIDILKGKMSHLEEKLREPLTEAELKVKLGSNMTEDDVMALGLSHMHTANLTIAKELETLTGRFTKLLRNYKKVQKEKLEELSLEYFKQMLHLDRKEAIQKTVYIEETVEEVEKCRGSTCPPSPESSEGDEIDEKSRDLGIKMLGVNATEVTKFHERLQDLKEELIVMDIKRNKSEPRFFSLVDVQSLGIGGVIPRESLFKFKKFRN